MNIELDFDEEREMEKDNMILEIEGITIEIPEELLEKRQEIFAFNNTEDNRQDILKTHKSFLQCYLQNESSFNLNDYNNKFVDFLKKEIKPFL